MLRLLLCFAAALCLSQAEEIYQVTIVDLNATAPATDTTRIIGGTPTIIERFPYTVQVLASGGFCGGSLITRRHVLSAAHCFITDNGVQISARTVTVRAGATNLQSGGTTRQVSAIIVHDRYNRFTMEADVAVLLLASALTLSNTIGTASLPAQGNSLNTNTPLIFAGWGHTSVNGQLSSVLQEVQVLKVDHTICRSNYDWLASQIGSATRVSDTMICAGLLNIGGADACQGDSGGPLALQSNRFVVVGVTSWGQGCGEPQFPGVSVRVASFSNWISNTVARYNSAPSLGLTSTVLLLASLLASLTLFRDA